MRVQFSPCGLGLGHVGRCIPLAKKLDERGVQILFSTYSDGVGYAQREGFPVVKVPPIEFMVKPDGTVDFRQTVVNTSPLFASFTLLKQVNAEIEIMKAFRPDVVVSDSRISPLIAGKLLEIPTVCILNQFQIIVPRKRRFLRLAKLVDAGALAIIGKIWTTGTVVLIPDFPLPYTISIRNLRIPHSYKERVRLIGTLLLVHPEELPSKKVIRRKLKLDIDKTVIFVPISGPEKERSYFTNILQQIFRGFPDDYQIVMSLGDPRSSTEPVRKGNVTIYRWMPNRFEYLKACDLVIARAGHGTMTQSTYYGKPLILVPTPSHTEQNNNAKRAVELGIAEMIEQKRLSKQTLLKSIQKILESTQFQKLKQVQKDLKHFNGVETAVKIIMEAAKG